MPVCRSSGPLIIYFLYLYVMEKEFNVTGNCLPDRHYMADTSAKFKSIMRLVEQGKYFAINRPRQYGKTTMLFALTDALKKNDDYVVFRLSFEGVGDVVFETEEKFCEMFLDLLRIRAEQQKKTELEQAISVEISKTHSFKLLSAAISNVVSASGRKVVVLIDEVDKSSNNQLFVSFLGILRDKYLERGDIPTFHSVVLAGVHDVKSLKLKIRPEEERKLNSPWNISADFKVNMNLLPNEIRPMLEEYGRDRSVEVDAQAVAERLFYHTSGHPFLVSSLCKMFDEDMLLQKTEQTWTVDDVDTAAYQLAKESTVNFDDLSKNLDNNEVLYQLTQDVALNNRQLPFNVNDPVANLGILYGIFANREGYLAIHNRIYQEVITSKMSFKAMRLNGSMLQRHDDGFWMPGNHLDIRKVLLKFQEMMREEQSKKYEEFIEREGRLLFLAFLKPVLNGHGYALKEPQISDEKRLDVFVAYHERRYVVELKLWYGQQAHENGLDQLTAYLDSMGLEEGYLLIFDHRKTKQWADKEVVWKGKKIFIVWT
jgi:AAA-like domain